MTKNIVFLVHGIGQHPPGWSREPDRPIVALDNAWKLYQDLKPEAPLTPNVDDHLEFVEICYDDIFDTVINTWTDLGKSIPASTNFPWVNEVTQLMNSVGTKNGELFLRFAGDVLLYCGFKLVARTIRLRVA